MSDRRSFVFLKSIGGADSEYRRVQKMRQCRLVFSVCLIAWATLTWPRFGLLGIKWYSLRSSTIEVSSCFFSSRFDCFDYASFVFVVRWKTKRNNVSIERNVLLMITVCNRCKWEIHHRIESIDQVTPSHCRFCSPSRILDGSYEEFYCSLAFHNSVFSALKKSSTNTLKMNLK